MKKEKGKTPQQKKKLSLEKDHPTLHAKSNKGGRIGRPRIKKQFNEAFRRKAKAAIKANLGSPKEELEDSVKSIKREKWWPGKPGNLAETIRRKKAQRIKNHGAKKNRRERESEKKRLLGNIIAEIKKEPKYSGSTEEKIRNVAFSRYLERLRKNGAANGKPLQANAEE